MDLLSGCCCYRRNRIRDFASYCASLCLVASSVKLALVPQNFVVLYERLLRRERDNHLISFRDLSLLPLRRPASYGVLLPLDLPQSY